MLGMLILWKEQTGFGFSPRTERLFIWYYSCISDGYHL